MQLAIIEIIAALFNVLVFLITLPLIFFFTIRWALRRRQK